MERKKDIPKEGMLIRTELREFRIPPVKDGLVLGKRAPIGCVAIRKALDLLTPNHYEHIELKNDDVLSDVLIRKAILNRLPEEKLVEFVKKNIKPLMTETEVLHLELEVIINLEERL